MKTTKVNKDPDHLIDTNKILKKRFKAKPLDKHFETSLGVLIEQSVDKVMKKNPLKKMSMRKAKKATNIIKRELKLRYDPYAMFHQKNKKAYSNVEHIFKTPKGRLYLDPDVIPRIVITSHAILRFEQRIRNKDKKELFDYIERNYEANSLKFLIWITSTSSSYYVKGSNIYLACRIKKNKDDNPFIALTIYQKVQSVLLLKTVYINKIWKTKKDIPKKDFKDIPEDIYGSPELGDFLLSKIT